MPSYLLKTDAALTPEMIEKVLYHACRHVPEKNPEGPGLKMVFKAATLQPFKPKLEVYARRWFQKTYGNTYHSVRVLIDGAEVAHCSFAYGYGLQYSQTAVELLRDAGLIPEDHPARYAADLQDLFDVSEHCEDVSRKRDL